MNISGFLKRRKCKSVADCSSDELTHIFIELFRSRFGNTSSCYPADNLANFFSQLHHLLFGHILYIEGIPCAFDIVLKSESQMNIYFDVSNGAIKNECRPLSPGSILMWLNISRARHYCRERQKLLFSIGILKPEWEYKRMWSTPILPENRFAKKKAGRKYVFTSDFHKSDELIKNENLIRI